MGLVLVTLVLALALGRALGGRVSRLDRLPYRGLPLLGGALAAALLGVAAAVAGAPTRISYGSGLAVSAGLVLAFCVHSRAVHGTGLVGVGLALNALAVIANGAMPVSAYAAARAGVDAATAVAGPLHAPAGADTGLPLLADRIPVPLPFRPEVASVGDLLVAAGVAQLVVTAMRPGGSRRSRGHRRTPTIRA